MLVLHVEKERQEEVAATIEYELLQSLASLNIQARNTRLVLEIKDEEAELVAGLTASTSYGWLLIKTLWVREDLRGNGLGGQLMAAAELEGRELGCHGAWLDTSSMDARQFYLRHGYEDFGTLENRKGQFPAGHMRWFMKRDLTDE